MEIRLVRGNILDLDSAAWVLGVCQDVTPSGAAHAIDARLGGAIAEFTARRMFSGAAGEIFMLPASRHPVPVDTIVFAGLGPFDRLTGEVQQFVAENVIRTLIRARVDEFVCLLLGARSGRGAGPTLEAMLQGFRRGIRDADGGHRIRRITICELDPDQFAELRPVAQRFNVKPLSLRERVPSSDVGRVRAVDRDPLYLLVRSESNSPKSLTLHASVLTAGSKATVVTGSRKIVPATLDRHLAQLDDLWIDFDAMQALRRFGAKLSRMVLPPEILELLAALPGRHIVVVHDRESSRIPWETLPAASGGLSRRYLAAGMPVAKWLEQRRRDKSLRVLLVADPTGDLPSAAAEGRRLEIIAQTHPEVVLTILRNKKATKRALLKHFQSGEFDLLHYAGHAFFDAQNPEFSGIVCAGDEVLSGRELSGLGNLPSLVFFNACEAGRIRNSRRVRNPGEGRLDINVSLAEAFLRGGVANYIGTYWPVGDASASTFAATFYKELLAGHSLGDALLASRQRLQRLGSIDWADYVHYGDFNFVLKATDPIQGRL